MKIYISIYLLFIITLSTQANTYYVAPDGNNIDSGNFQNPWKTIKYGISDLQAGDTLYIRDGKYSEVFKISNKLGNEGNPIVISGYSEERPVIDGDGLVAGLWSSLISFESNEYIIFQNIEVTNSRGTGIRILSSDHITLRNIWVHYTGYDGIEGKYSDYLTVEDSRLWNTNIVNDEDGPWYEYFMWGGAITSCGDDNASGPAAHDIVIRGNEIFQNYGEGINMWGHNDGVIIEDNTFWDCWAPAIHFPNSENILIQRNLLYHTNDAEFLREGEPSTGIAFINEVPPTKPGNIKDITVINNLVMGFNNSIVFWEDEIGGTIQNVLIAHNTFVDAHANTGESESIFILNTAIENIRIENNIILQEDNSASLGYSTATSGISYSHNLWYPGNPPDNMQSDNDILQNPLISRSGSTGPGLLTPDYFKIGVNSPAIGAGKILPEVTEDFSGRARTGNPAIGAFESNVTTNINKNNNLDNFVKIYPNPVSKKLNIIIDGDKYKNYTLRLFDIKGRLVKKVIINNAEKDLITIDRKDLISGIYILNILTDNKIIVNKKMIIE